MFVEPLSFMSSWTDTFRAALSLSVWRNAWVVQDHRIIHVKWFFIKLPMGIIILKMWGNPIWIPKKSPCQTLRWTMFWCLHYVFLLQEIKQVMSVFIFCIPFLGYFILFYFEVIQQRFEIFYLCHQNVPQRYMLRILPFSVHLDTEEDKDIFSDALYNFVFMKPGCFHKELKGFF